MNNPYMKHDPPQMLPSFVCYADILGYSQLSQEALRSNNGLQFLHKLKPALKKAHDRIEMRSKGWGVDSLFSVKVFTDNIVIGYPLENPRHDLGEPELGNLMDIVSEFQIGLATEGYFLRGGIAFGKHYMDDDVVFGDAFLQAVGQDKGGGPPRISLVPSITDMIRGQLDFYSDPNSAPHNEELLEDSDGTIFLNYLDVAFIAFPDGGIFLDLIKEHQQNIMKGLHDYKGNSGIRAKYEWAARYHNFVCREFTERHPFSSNPDADPMYIAAIEEAQTLIDYTINIEELAPKPRRIHLTPTRTKRHE